MTTLTLRSDRSLIRSSDRSVRYVLLTVTAPVSSGPRAPRSPVDIAFVIDRSGSMRGEKLDLAREAVVQGINLLSPDDRFTVVAYDDEVSVVSALARASSDQRERAAVAVRRLREGGSTNLSGGWLAGCMQLADAADSRDIRKCLLMSDGQANAGITDSTELNRHASELRERGIATSTFGVGEGFDEELMTGMSRSGGGQAYFIRHARQTADLLTSELNETLDVVARDAVVRLSVPEGVTLEVLSDFDSHANGKSHDLRLGHLVSGQSVSLLVRVEYPAGAIGRTVALAASVVSREEAESPWTELAWTYASDDANESQERNKEVDAAVVMVDAARARREALRFNRTGDFASARRVIGRACVGLAARAVDHPEALAELRALDGEAPVFAAAMPTRTMKEFAYAVTSALRSRDKSGKATRSEVRSQK